MTLLINNKHKLYVDNLDNHINNNLNNILKRETDGNRLTFLNCIIEDKNVFYTSNSVTHENYWFQDLSNSIFNLDKALKIFPNNDMTYAEKINTLVRLSIYFGLILSLFYLIAFIIFNDRFLGI